MNKLGSSTSQFLQSNTLVGKFAIIILALVIFMTLLKFGLIFIGWAFSPPDDVHIFDGMHSQPKGGQVFSQNPNDKGSVPIKRSVDGETGIEFTWSVWVFVDHLPTISACQASQGVPPYLHIFHKGSGHPNPDDSQKAVTTAGETDGSLKNEVGSINKSDQNQIDVFSPNNSPGLYLAPVENNTLSLVVIYNTYRSVNELIKVPNMPTDKWFNVCIRCKNTTIDIYVNGTIVKRHKSNGVPFQNYGPISIGDANGAQTFNGYISNLWYFNRALSVTEIRSIVKDGPNTIELNKKSNLHNDPKYFSLRWFFDSYNTDYGGL